MKGGARVGAGRKPRPITTLEELYKDDPTLLKLYKKKLRMKGWAGALSPEEKDYIKRKGYSDKHPQQLDSAQKERR